MTNNAGQHVLPLDSIAAERHTRIRFLDKPDESVRCRFREALLSMDEPGAQERVRAAWDYAQSLDYHHPGQNKEVYLAHPMRVATLYIRLVRHADVQGVVTAIMHNVLEVTPVSRDEVTREVGSEVADALVALTVDREQQWDYDYKDRYYGQLNRAPEFVRRVKILDKLDNLFLLCLNPSDDVRGRYLDEVEKWLLPMTEDVLPRLKPYLQALVADCRRIGHMP